MADGKSTPQMVSRRNALRLGLIGAGAAAASLTVGAQDASAEDDANPSKRSGYAETAHIRAYYASTRI